MATPAAMVPALARKGTGLTLETSLVRFLELLERCDRGDAMSLPLTMLVLEQFDALVHDIDRHVRELPAAAGALGAQLRAALLPVLSRSENAWRWVTKPRGYAGDYLTIARIYDDEATGDTAVDALIDRCFLRMPAVRAVQHRRRLLVDEIRATIARGHDRPARVTSLACGPAREVFDTLAWIDEPRALDATLIDFDKEALDFCAVENARRGLGDLRCVNANLIHVALGRRSLELEPQDLIYSIGLIDYFPDNLVVKLIDRIHELLHPGGRVILGNFHPRNPTRGVMEHLLDWKLVHRDEDQMHALFRASAFGTGCTRVMFEAERINLFAECVKL